MRVSTNDRCATCGGSPLDCDHAGAWPAIPVDVEALRYREAVGSTLTDLKRCRAAIELTAAIYAGIVAVLVCW